MKELKWDLTKNERLKKVRGVSFEEVVNSKLIAIKEHPTKEIQSLMLFEFRGYVWVVPFVEEKEYIFLKTLYPSRRYTKSYRKGEIK